MSKRNLKLMSAGVLVAVAFGVVVRIAWATTGQGVTPTVIAGPIVLDSIDVKVEDEDYALKLKTKGLSDARVVHFRVVPGGFFGWHTHPGPAFAMITAGTLTLYDAHDPDHAVDYEAGTGFVDQGGDHVHDARNEGDVDVEIVVFFLTPQGTPIRIDADAP